MGGGCPPGAPDWTREYRRRAAVVMRIFADGGQWWVSTGSACRCLLRPARGDLPPLDAALADAARAVPGVRYVAIWARLSDGGRYAPYLRDDAGRTVLARTRDGIHLSQDGARIAARLVPRQLDADFQVLR